MSGPVQYGSNPTFLMIAWAFFLLLGVAMIVLGGSPPSACLGVGVLWVAVTGALVEQSWPGSKAHRAPVSRPMLSILLFVIGAIVAVVALYFVLL